MVADVFEAVLKVPKIRDAVDREVTLETFPDINITASAHRVGEESVPYLNVEGQAGIITLSMNEQFGGSDGEGSTPHFQIKMLREGDDWCVHDEDGLELDEDRLYEIITMIADFH